MRRAHIAEAQGKDVEALGYAREAIGDAATREALAAVVKLGVRTGDYASAVLAARAGLEHVPPDDPAAMIEARLDLADLHRMAGDPAAAFASFEHVLAEDPRNVRALTAIAALAGAGGSPAAATRALRTLASLTDAPARKAELVWRLGELHLAQDDVELADDEFLRASDLDPAHVPTLRRLIDVYWRADEPALLLDVANDLTQRGELLAAATEPTTLARAMIAASASAAMHLAAGIADHLAAAAAAAVAHALAELGAQHRELPLDAAAAALRELARKGHGPSLMDVVAEVQELVGDDAADTIATALTGG